MPTRNWGSKGPLKTGSCGTLVLPGTLLIRGLNKFLIGFFVVDGEPTGGSSPDYLTPPYGIHRQLYPVTSGHPFRLPAIPVLLGLDTGLCCVSFHQRPHSLNTLPGLVTCLEDGREPSKPQATQECRMGTGRDIGRWSYSVLDEPATFFRQGISFRDLYSGVWCGTR